MNAANDDTKTIGTTEGAGQDAACGAGCSCNAPQPGGRGRTISGIMILLVAAALVARAMIRTRNSQDSQCAATFAAVAPATDPAPQPGVPGQAAQAVNKEPALTGQTQTQATVVAAIVGHEIKTLSDLNNAAAQTDAVFVYMPGQGGGPQAKAPTSLLEGAARTIKSQGVNVGIFTLKAGAPAYTQLAAQMKFPGVIVMVKGRGMGAVSGDITENKIIQAYVAASSTGGGMRVLLRLRAEWLSLKGY